MDNETAMERAYEVEELQNPGTLAVLAKAEIDVQISTAHAYPRSLTKFRNKAMTMLMLDENVAQECFYVIPRAGKTIEGPSVRLAEIVAASYGNMRSGARVVAEEAEFVVAQGVCHDLENNLAVTFEVKRRITDRNGNRYPSDMIGVTGNAASSIAFRNTVFRVVPKVLWLPLYEAARRVARGDEKTFGVRREAVLIAFEKLKVPRKRIFEYLGVAGIEDMNSDHLVALIGIGNAIKSGEATIETAFDVADAQGRVETEKDSPLRQQAPKASPAPPQESQPSQREAPKLHDISICVGQKDSTIVGDVRAIVKELPKLGAKLSAIKGQPGVWTMPAARTHELLALCETKKVTWVEVDSEGHTVPQAQPEDGEEHHETLFEA